MSRRDQVGACLFYADCLFDVLLALHLFEMGHPSWGSLIIAFITLQYLTVWLSVLPPWACCWSTHAAYFARGEKHVRSLSPRPVDRPFARVVVIAFPWAMLRTKSSEQAGEAARGEASCAQVQ